MGSGGHLTVRAHRRLFRLAFIAGAALIATPAFAQTSQASISGLTDIAFGTVSFSSDLTSAQNLCVYVGPVSNKYNVKAVGSGASSAFTLQSGSFALAYDVQWSGTTGQTSGTALTAGVAKSGFTSAATATGCSAGPATSASLIVIVRATQAAAASAASYSGTLTITITPE